MAAFCRSLHEMNPSDPSPSPQDATGPQLATMRQLTDADKLRKVICELLETERTYVKVRLPAHPPSPQGHCEGGALWVTLFGLLGNLAFLLNVRISRIVRKHINS